MSSEKVFKYDSTLSQHYRYWNQSLLRMLQRIRYLCQLQYTDIKTWHTEEKKCKYHRSVKMWHTLPGFWPILTSWKPDKYNTGSFLILSSINIIFLGRQGGMPTPVTELTLVPTISPSKVWQSKNLWAFHSLAFFLPSLALFSSNSPVDLFSTSGTYSVCSHLFSPTSNGTRYPLLFSPFFNLCRWHDQPGHDTSLVFHSRVVIMNIRPDYCCRELNPRSLQWWVTMLSMH